jgi:hypothetical protein
MEVNESEFAFIADARRAFAHGGSEQAGDD